MTGERTPPEIGTSCGAGIFPWQLILVWGLFSLGIGVLVLAIPEITSAFLLMSLGALWLAGGFLSLAGLAAGRTDTGLKIFLAAISIVAGALVLIPLAFPAIVDSSPSSFTIATGFFAWFIGCSHLAAAFRHRDPGNGVLGITSLTFGLLLFAFPLVAAAMVPFIAGMVFTVSGISAVIASFMLRRSQDVYGA